jgi:1-acyl-sn-glycerol-3-phosphate acyltransferase
MRAKVPIVPVCVVGAEEAAPIFAHMSWLQRLTGLLYAPISPIFPVTLFMPAKFRLRFLEPIRFDEDDMWLDKSLVQTVSQEIRARIQENVWEMVAERKSVWFG